MLQSFSRVWRIGIIRTFLAGLIFLLPVVLTVVIIQWLIQWVRDSLGPETFLGSIMTRGGRIFLGAEYDLFSFWAGLSIALIGIWLAGVIVTWQARRRIDSTFDAALARVPLFRAVYRPVARVVRMISSKNPEEFAGMSVVICRFGGKQSVDVLALLASPATYLIGGERRKMVYLPSSPLPMTGALVLASEETVIPVPEMQPESLMKVYFSLGSLGPENIPET